MTNGALNKGIKHMSKLPEPEVLVIPDWLFILVCLLVLCFAFWALLELAWWGRAREDKKQPEVENRVQTWMDELYGPMD